MERVKSDLNKSKQARERQVKEFQRQLQDEQHKYEQQVDSPCVVFVFSRYGKIPPL